MLIWKLVHDVRKHKFQNETSRRINRNLWNRLTIDAEIETDFEFVEKMNESDMICSRYLWDYWISSIPVRNVSQQINKLTEVIINAENGPNIAVHQLNWQFWHINFLFMLTRLSILVYIYAVKMFILRNRNNGIKITICLLAINEHQFK